MERYYEYLKSTHPELGWGGWFVDEAVSAYKNPLITRKGGAALNCALRLFPLTGSFPEIGCAAAEAGCGRVPFMEFSRMENHRILSAFG